MRRRGRCSCCPIERRCRGHCGLRTRTVWGCGLRRLGSGSPPSTQPCAAAAAGRPQCPRNACKTTGASLMQSPDTSSRPAHAGSQLATTTHARARAPRNAPRELEHLDAAARAREHAQQPLRLEAALLVRGFKRDAAPELGALAEAAQRRAGARNREAGVARRRAAGGARCEGGAGRGAAGEQCVRLCTQLLLAVGGSEWPPPLASRHSGVARGPRTRRAAQSQPGAPPAADGPLTGLGCRMRRSPASLWSRAAAAAPSLALLWTLPACWQAPAGRRCGEPGPNFPVFLSVRLLGTQDAVPLGLEVICRQADNAPQICCI